MRPQILPPLPIHSYGLLIVIGFLLGTYLGSREARRRGMTNFDVPNFSFVLLLTGILGARLFYYIEHFQVDFANRPWWEFFKIWNGGLVFYGGGIAGFLGGLYYLYHKKLPIGDCLDVTAPFIPIGMGFGRLGCLMNGCCFGKVCSGNFLLGLTFPKETEDGFLTGVFSAQLEQNLVKPAAEAPLPVFPTQLYEASYDFLLFGMLLWYSRGPSPRWGMTPLLFVMYGIGRFFLEFLRGDNLPTFTTLTTSQNWSLVLILVFLPLFIYTWVRNLGGHPGLSLKNSENLPKKA